MRFLTLLLCFFSFSASATTPAEPQIIQGVLDNGLRYTILPFHKQKNRVDIRIRVYAGSVDEDESQIGGAHMVEHMVFRGSQQYPDGVGAALLQKQWVRAKHYNAVTNVDNTTYMLSPPLGVKQLDEALFTLHQMLFRANFSAKDLNDERKIILEEWRSGQGVAARMNVQRTATIRANSRYARWPVIGSANSIQTMSVENLHKFYRTWYHPNNMQLMIIGDVNPEDVKSLIVKNFGAEKSANLPKRDYHDPELAARLAFKQLQDKQSSVSQISYIFRINEKAAHQDNDEGRKLRLLDRLTLSAVLHRLQNQQENLPQGVKSLVIRKSDIGENTAAIGLFASVDKTSHQIGLQKILTEIARLKQYPITAKELAEEKKPIYEQLEFAAKGGKQREFDDWVNVLNNTLLLNKPYYSQKTLAAKNKPILDKITTADVQQHLLRWLEAQDRIVQYQAPRETLIEPITESIFNRLQQMVTYSPIGAPITKQALSAMQLLPVDKQGKITSEQHFAQENVVHWQLENGDKVVWLKTPLAKDRTFFRATNSGGFMAEGLSPWISQLAVQLAEQNPPKNWQIEQLTQWKKDHKVSLNFEQKMDRLNLNGETENQNLADLLRLYYATQTEIEITEGIDETIEEITKQLEQQTAQDSGLEKSQALRKLRYGKTDLPTTPPLTQLKTLTAEQLNQQWFRIRQLPTTFYFANNLDETQMKTLVQTYLALLPRTKALNLKLEQPLKGEMTQSIAANIEPRTDITFNFFTDMTWKGEDAMLVSLVRQIAIAQLKAELRDKSLGIYRLRLDSMLNPDTNRIESELTFGTKPELAQKLAEQAKTVLRQLPSKITEQDLESFKHTLQLQENERQKDIRSQFNRLILSEEHYQNPHYLTESQHLLQKANVENVKAMAEKMINSGNMSIFFITPIAK